MMPRCALVLAVVVGCGGAPQVAPAPSHAVEPAPGTASADDAHGSARWVRQLDRDMDGAERAVDELELLGDPAAIEPLGAHWARSGQVRPLQVMIELARPLTPAEAQDKHLVIYARSGRPASWDRALPFLRKALVGMDDAAPRSVDSAVSAATAVGEAKLTAALPDLVELAKRPPSKKLVSAQTAAIRALGRLETERVAATAGLVALLARDAPAHPRTAKTKEEGRKLEENFALHLMTTGAAVSALAELRADAVEPLVLQLYTTPELFMHVRRALVASGPGAADELRKVLRGEHAAVNRLVRDKQLDRYCGEMRERPAVRCQKVAPGEYYAAVVLGDLYDARAVPDLLAALKKPAQPAYYIDDAPGATQHLAIFDALRKLGSPEAGPAIRALWTKTGRDLMTQIGAVGTYAFVARDAAATQQLAKLAADNRADDTLRQEAATALARLGRGAPHIAIMNQLARRYHDASNKKRVEADGAPKTRADAADKELASVKLAFEQQKATLLQMTSDPNATAGEIRAETDLTKQSEEVYKVAKQAHRDEVAPYKQANAAAKAYLGYARTFQTHTARIEIAMRCKDDVTCYGASLELTLDQAARNVTRYIDDLASWTAEEKLGLVEASIDRAMLELGKRGAKAEALTDKLLDHAASDNRAIRQAILLALPKIARLPCPSCVTKLAAAAKAGEGNTTLGPLTLETEVLRLYFGWAGAVSRP